MTDRWHESGQIFEDLREYVLARAYAMDADIDGLPKTPEDFAAVAVRLVVQALSNGLGMMAREIGWHPNDPRWDQPDPADVPPGS